MDIRIGIVNTGRELSFSSDSTAAEVTGAVERALGEGGHLSLDDSKGNTYLVPTANLAYVQLGSDQTRRVGFVG